MEPIATSYGYRRCEIHVNIKTLSSEQDFGIYVVNMFDTGQAARFPPKCFCEILKHTFRVLELPRKGLAYLLKHYCAVQTDKKYQLAGIVPKKC